jgi:hypothetical protein
LLENDYEDEGIQWICEALAMNTTLTNLDLRRVADRYDESGDVDDEDYPGYNDGTMKFVADAIIKNTTLVQLDVRGRNTLGVEGVACLFYAMQHNRTLKSLEFSRI